MAHGKFQLNWSCFSSADTTMCGSWEVRTSNYKPINELRYLQTKRQYKRKLMKWWLKKKVIHLWHIATNTIYSMPRRWMRTPLPTTTQVSLKHNRRAVYLFNCWTICAIESKNQSNIRIVCTKTRHKKLFNFNLMFFDQLQLWKLINTITEPEDHTHNIKCTEIKIKQRWRPQQRC